MSEPTPSSDGTADELAERRPQSEQGEAVEVTPVGFAPRPRPAPRRPT